MSSSLSHTLDQDVDDDELCMVCDGKCTCSSQPVASTSSAPPPPPIQQQQPKLKIKLLPPKIPSGIPPDLPNQLLQPQPQPKRRGRPPKNGISAAPRSRPKATAPPRRPPPKKQIQGGIKKRQPAAKRARVDSTDDDSSSDLTDIDQFYPEHRVPTPRNDDATSSTTRFQTFISSSSSSSSLDSDSSSLSDFDSDSSIEAEEETFIIAQERARVRRELIGDETLQKRRDNNWVIRPRKRSVGTPSDVDMDGDSDGSDENDEDDEEEAQDELADEEEDEHDESDRPGNDYVGVATGFSDDESSFDADLFFANLSSDSDTDTSLTLGDDEGVDGDHSDLETSAPNVRPIAPNLSFEVSEGWNGQILFTNGLGETHAASLDVPFLASPMLLPIQSAPESGDGDRDVDMLSTTEADEEGYEQDVDTVGEGDDGDTTDEELVGDDDLPNERAMQLFNTPFTSVSFINPLSTMSPVNSPGPKRDSPSFGFDYLKPADILAGRMYYDSDEPDEGDDDSFKKLSLSSPRPSGPRQGNFEIMPDIRRAVIDDQHKDIPSPHPCFKGRHNRLSSSQSIGLEALLRRTLQPIRHSSMPPATRFPVDPSSSTELPSISPGLPPTQAVDIDDVLDSSFLDSDPPVDSDMQDYGDVETSSTESVYDDDDSRRHMRNLKRWDLISVGAFRKTREAVGGGCLSDGAAGWGSDSPADYSNVMKSSPLSTMLWQRNGQQPGRPPASYAMSPELRPLTDGDRTPTNNPPRTPVKTQAANGDQQNYQQYHHQSNKTRKDIRRERRLKQKGFAASRHQNRNHHHFHQHHPNSKSRSTSSTQRTKFFSSPSSMPALSI